MLTATSLPGEFGETYNVCTIDPIAILLRQHREADERRAFEDEPGHTWPPEAPPLVSYSTQGPYEPASDKAFRVAAAEYARRRAGDPDAPHETLAAAATGRKYYQLPSEPLSWRRPLRPPRVRTTPCGGSGYLCRRALNDPSQMVRLCRCS